MKKYVDFDEVKNLVRDSMRGYSIEGKDILVINVNGKFHAMDMICTHRGVRPDEGWYVDGKVVCLGHLSEFDCEDGKAVNGPSEIAQSTYEIRIVEDRLQVKI